MLFVSSGLLSVASYSFLVSITKREQVAQILGKPIFVVTGVSVIPLSSQTDASKAILLAQSSYNDEKKIASGIDGAQDSETDQSEALDVEQADVNPDSLLGTIEREGQTGLADQGGESHIAEDVIKKRGRYRRFASQWFFDKIWQGEGKAPVDTDSRRLSDPAARGRQDDQDSQRRDSDSLMELDDVDSTGRRLPPPLKSPGSVENDVRTYELMPKLLRYTKMFFGSRSFYFSYDYDISRRFEPQDPQMSRLPLSTRADPLVPHPIIEVFRHIG